MLTVRAHLGGRGGAGEELRQEGQGDVSHPMSEQCLPYVNRQAVFVRYTGHEK